MRIDEFRARLQPHLDGFLAGKIQSLSAYSSDSFLLSLLDYPARLASGNGKRIRPYVAYLLFRSLRPAAITNDKSDEAAMRFLVALELFHLFCLVHDDVIDRGTKRYGLPTIQRFVASEMAAQNRLNDHERIGDAQAMLAGDLLFAWSQDAFNSSRDFAPDVLDRARGYFNRMIEEVVIGQMIDVDAMTRSHTTRDALEQKIILKTASYTFIRPMQIGAVLAQGADAHSSHMSTHAAREQEKYCHELGLALGIAFQTQDDLLDLAGTPQQTQKTLFSDLREGQHTPFTQFIFECGTKAEQDRLRLLWNADLGVADRARVLELFESSGALDHGRKQIAHHLNHAARLIENGPLRPDERAGFSHLIASITARG